MRYSAIVLCISIAAISNAQADVVTSLSFASPGAIQAGGTVTVDFTVSFNPQPGSVGSTEFIDNATSTPLSSCSVDPNSCTEIQILTTASTLTSVFAELLTANTPTGIPNFYPETTTGTFPITLPYPDPGVWDITTAGDEQEQFSELDCTTPFFAGAATASPSCSTIQTISFTGKFDAAGVPQLFVNVEPAGTAPEPGSLALGATGLILWAAKRRPSRPR